MSHAAIPILDASMRRREAVMAGIKEITEDAIEIEIEKMGPVIEQERPVEQHLLKGHQQLRQLLKQFLLLPAPLIEATAAKLPFLMPQKAELVRSWDEFLPINIIQLEADAFDLVFDVAPKDALLAFQFPRKQTELQLRIQVFGNYLRIFVHLKNNRPSILNDRNAVVPLFA